MLTRARIRLKASLAPAPGRDRHPPSYTPGRTSRVFDRDGMAGGQSPLEQWLLYMLTIRAALQHPISKQGAATGRGLEVTQENQHTNQCAYPQAARRSRGQI